MNRYLVLAVLVCLFFAANYETGHVGFASNCVNGKCHVAASASMSSIAGGLAIVAFALGFPRRRYERNTSRPVLLWQRAGAMFIDFFVVIWAFSPLLALPMLIVEADHTGTFAWSFERDFARGTDILAVPLIFVMFAVLYFYHYLHIKYRRPTIGQYIAGYIIESETGPEARPNFAGRVFLAFIGLCMWPVSLYYALKREDKSLWWESATDTRATRVRLQRA